jgi:hypothetical protein
MAITDRPAGGNLVEQVGFGPAVQGGSVRSWRR